MESLKPKQETDVINAMRPDERSFECSIYPASDVERDLAQLRIYQNTPAYAVQEKRSDAKLLELTFMKRVELGDWFGEDANYRDDPNFQALITFPTSEIDDIFNHIDVICVIQNKATKHEVIPFAVDLTYNTDDEKMAKKFSWRHVYGKKKAVRSDVSEFGTVYIDREGTPWSRPLPLEDRYGLKIPGFASAKYFEDTNNIWNQVHPKGRIFTMPRFIVGYSTELANELSTNNLNPTIRNRYGEAAYQKMRERFDDAGKCAKWCVLSECYNQTKAIGFMLDNLKPETIGLMRENELEKAKRQIAGMEHYFANAIRVANELAEDDPRERAAREYAKYDKVCQAIIYHSQETYQAKKW